MYFLDDTKFKNKQIKTPLNGGNLVIFYSFFKMTSCMSIANFCHFPSLVCHLSFCHGDFSRAASYSDFFFFSSFFSVLEIDSYCVCIPEIYRALLIMACATIPGLIFKPAKLNQGCLHEHGSGVIYWVIRKCVLFVMLDTSQLD